MRNIRNYTILSKIGILTATFTAAVTDIITANAHGLKNGDMVVLTTTTTLPAGLSLATVYYAIEVTTNTFKLSASPVAEYTTNQGGANPTPVDITSTGTGTHTFTMHDIGKNINVSDFRHLIVSVHGNDNANLDIGFLGSIGKSVDEPNACPDFSAASTFENSHDFLDIVSTSDDVSINGAADSISMTGTNVNKLYEINVNGLEWFNAILSGWSAGGVTINIKLFND